MDIASQDLDHLTSRKRWTREEYYRMNDLGLFGPELRLELIAGDIIQKMRQGAPHATGISLAEAALSQAFPTGHLVRTQMPLPLDDSSEPEPDVAVVVGSVRDFVREHPTTAVLVVEVSDTTLRMDRKIKANLYARAGIPDYWIVNLVDRALEVRREPVPMGEQPLGYAYRSVQVHGEGDVVSPLAAPEAAIAVADLLP